MELKGTVKVVMQEQQISDTFKKRNIVITTEDQYPQSILVEFTQDSCNDLNNISKGDMVTIGINIRGREWTNPQGEIKYFNAIQGWRITKD